MHSSGGHLPLFIEEGEVPTNFLSSFRRQRGRKAYGLERVEMNLFPNFASTEQAAEYIRDNLHWTLRESSAPNLGPLPLDYDGLCPRFDLGVVARYAHESNIPEMMQAIFYAMVVHDAAELGISHRLTMNCVMWAMRKLDWGPVESWLGDTDRRLKKAHASRLANPSVGPAPLGGLMGRRTTSFPTFQNTMNAAEYVRDNLR